MLRTLPNLLKTSCKEIIKTKKHINCLAVPIRQIYEQTFRKSVDAPEEFWHDIAQDITWFQKYSKVLDHSNPPFTKWFVGGEMNTCYEAIDKHVESGYGEEVAVIYDSPVTGVKESFTYRSMQEQVGRFARVLVNLGVEKGDRVIIYMPMIPQALIAIYGCARIGAIHSVVFGGFAAKELSRRIDDCKPKVLVTASCGIEPKGVLPYEPLVVQALEASSHQPLKVITVNREQCRKQLYNPDVDVDWDDALAHASSHDCIPVDSNDPLYILYTSGTTGSPKGIVRPNGGHAVALKWSMKNLYNINPGDVWWAASDIGWVVGHSYIVYAPLFNRSATVLFEGKPIGTPDASTFFRMIEEHNIKSLFTAPTAIRVIKNEDANGEQAKNFDLSRFDTLFVAGENADLELLEWAANVFKKPVIDHWWQTESGWAITNHHLGLGLPSDYKFGSIGKPSPGWDVKVMNKEMNQCKPGELGQIFVRLPLPPGAMSTLWNDEERFIQSYFKKVDGYYDSSDAGSIDENGYIRIEGRLDDIINVAGHRLSTKQMEIAVAKHGDVIEQAVIGIKDDIKGLVPVGLVVLHKDCIKKEETIINEIIQKVRDDIGPVAAFKNVIVLPCIPKTRAGKFIRGVLKKILDGDEYTAPQTIENVDDFIKVEQILLQVKND